MTDPARAVEIRCDGISHRVQTSRLVLRALQLDDLDALLTTMDADVCRWQGWTGLPIEQLAQAMCAPPPDAGVRHDRFAIVDRASGEIIGARSWQGIGGRPDACDTGSWLITHARGVGYGSEELRAFLLFAHRHLGFQTVRAQTDRRNAAARRQYEAAGFEVYVRAEHRRLPNGSTARGRGYRHRDARFTGSCQVDRNEPPSPIR